MQAISKTYTLFSRIPVFFSDTLVLTDPLWAKDLALHLEYLEDFVLCCPVEGLDKAPRNAVAVTGLPSDRVIALRRDYGYLSVLRNLVPNFRKVRHALRQTSVAHSGGAGWAFPLSFYILALAPFHRFLWVVVIESAFWMKPERGAVSARQWLRHHIYRILLRACLKRADARIFTTEAYRKFFRQPEDASLIAPAVWIDDHDILSREALETRLAALPEDEIRFIFPARLVAEKGTDTILEAIPHMEEMLTDEAPRISVDIMGTGPDAERCRTLARAHSGRIGVRMLEPVDYETEFLPILQGYHALLLANRYHEQPRVVFDGFSQGLPVISSRTEGVQEIVTENANALLYPIDDARALARAMLSFTRAPDRQVSMARAALETAKGHSHAAMHEARLAFFSRALGQALADP